MKTLLQIKDEVAIEEGFIDWEEYNLWSIDPSREELTDQVAKRYAQEALKAAAEQAKVKYHQSSAGVTVDKESITKIELK